MDKAIKKVLRQAVLVVEYRTGDINTVDGDVATTDIDAMIELEAALCEAFATTSDDAKMLEIAPQIGKL